MANTTVVPLQNAYETTLSSNINSSVTTITVDSAPSFSVPSGKKIPAVIDPKNNFREVVYITAISGSDLTVERGKADYDGGGSTANTHSAGAKLVITNHYGIFDDFADAIDSKLDANGGNTTTTFDMQVSGSNFRIRKDGSDMKLTDDNQSEITLSTLAAGGGADEKIKVSSNDTTAAYLDTKLVAGTNITLTENNDGGNETLTIDAASANTAVTTHIIYTPAFLTGGNAPETTIAIWDSVADGEFSIDIDGATHEVTGLNFNSPAVTSMAEVAAVIQTGIRTATGSTETCTWSGTEFVITSADTTASSAMTVTSTVAAPAGTDISGAGAGAYMDCDAGSTAAVTAAVVDPTADTGSVPALNANGNVDTDLLREVIDKDGYTAKGEIVVATAANTPGLLSVGADGTVLTADSGEATGVKWATNTKGGVVASDFTQVVVTNSGSEAILISYTVPANQLGTDNMIKLTAYLSDLDAGGSSMDIDLQYGATTIATVSPSTSYATTAKIEAILQANASTSAQNGMVQLNGGQAGASSTATGTGAEDSTGALTVKLTVAGGAGMDYTFEAGYVEFLPKV